MARVAASPRTIQEYGSEERLKAVDGAESRITVDANDEAAVGFFSYEDAEVSAHR